MAKRKSLRLPVVSLSAEYLVMGYLMRRNILAYKAPPNNEGYDLICIHPDPRYKPVGDEKPQVRIQVKSRYATEGTKITIKEASLDAFDFLIIALLNIGKFYGKHDDGMSGETEPVFYTLSNQETKENHNAKALWQNVQLTKPLKERFESVKNGAGFELIAKTLGVKRPSRNNLIAESE
jgi:hypothetical protein